MKLTRETVEYRQKHPFSIPEHTSTISNNSYADTLFQDAKIFLNNAPGSGLRNN